MKKILISLLILFTFINVEALNIFDVKYDREVISYSEKDFKKLKEDIKEFNGNMITIDQLGNIDDISINFEFNDNVNVIYNLNGFSISYNKDNYFIVLGENSSINIKGLKKDEDTSHNFNGYINIEDKKIINTDKAVYSNNKNGSFIKSEDNCNILISNITLGGNYINDSLINIDSDSSINFNNVNIINNRVSNYIIDIDGDNNSINFKESSINNNYGNNGLFKKSCLINVKGDSNSLSFNPSSIVSLL